MGWTLIDTALCFSLLCCLPLPPYTPDSCCCLHCHSSSMVAVTTSLGLLSASYHTAVTFLVDPYSSLTALSFIRQHVPPSSFFFHKSQQCQSKPQNKRQFVSGMGYAGLCLTSNSEHLASTSQPRTGMQKMVRQTPKYKWEVSSSDC